MIRPDARLVARIDLDRLAANWDALNTLSGQAECAAVIKANAYGHGVREIALTLVYAGCRMFFTAGYEEASELREILDPVLPDAIIAVFDSITGHDREAVLNRAVIPTINSLHDLGLFARWAGEAGTPLPAMLQLDTGNSIVTVLAGISVLIATINIVGGFMVTRRMLQMFKKS